MALPVRTASLSFEPVSLSVKEGDIIPVDILIYTGSDKAISTDVWVSYNPDYFMPAPSYESMVEKGSLFQRVDAKLISPGSLYMYGINESAVSAPANGKLATLFLQAKKTGQSEIRFQCKDVGTATSQIIKQDGALENIINCERTTSHTAQITISENSSVLGASTIQDGATSWIFIGLGISLGILATLLMVRYRRLQKLLAEAE